MSAETLLDVRGEMCPGPALRVERFLKENPSREPFTVVGDHRPILEALALLGERHGWRVAFEQAAGGDWLVRFRWGAGGDPGVRSLVG